MDDPSRYIMWKYLPYEDIVSLCQTNQAYSAVCNDPETWRFLLYRDFNIVADGSLNEMRNRYLHEREKQRIRSELTSYFYNKYHTEDSPDSGFHGIHRLHYAVTSYVNSMYPGALNELRRRRYEERRKMIEEYGANKISTEESARRMIDVAIDLLTEIISEESLKDERIANAPLRERMILIALKNLTPKEKEVLYELRDKGPKVGIGFTELIHRLGSADNASRLIPLVRMVLSGGTRIVSFNPEILPYL